SPRQRCRWRATSACRWWPKASRPRRSASILPSAVATRCRATCSRARSRSTPSRTGFAPTARCKRSGAAFRLPRLLGAPEDFHPEGGRLASGGAREHELPAFDIHPDAVLGRELAFQDRPRERVLDALLDRALQGPRAEHRVEAGLRQLGERRV